MFLILIQLFVLKQKVANGTSRLSGEVQDCKFFETKPSFFKTCAIQTVSGLYSFVPNDITRPKLRIACFYLPFLKKQVLYFKEFDVD